VVILIIDFTARANGLANVALGLKWDTGFNFTGAEAVNVFL
jgi:hypothetical protein